MLSRTRQIATILTHGTKLGFEKNIPIIYLQNNFFKTSLFSNNKAFFSDNKNPSNPTQEKPNPGKEEPVDKKSDNAKDGPEIIEEDFMTFMQDDKLKSDAIYEYSSKTIFKVEIGRAHV